MKDNQATATTTIQSSQSTNSLLERIQRARQRERQHAQSSQDDETQRTVVAHNTPAVSLIPNSVVSHDNSVAHISMVSDFSNALMTSLSRKGNNGMAALESDDNDMRQALLSEDANDELVIIEEQPSPSATLAPVQAISLDDNYSMSAYFRMFVMDVYSLFQKLPVAGRVVLVLVSLWLVWRLL